MPASTNGAHSRPKFKTSFKALKTYEPVHTGGKAALSGDGQWLVSTLNDQAVVTQLDTGERIKQLAGDASEVSTLAITPTPTSPDQGGFVLTCNKSLALHIYSLPSLELYRTIPKAHDAPIITCCSDPTGTLFATGSADGVVKVWDAKHAHCTHVFKGHGGIISALVFDIGDNGQRARLVSGADDCRIRLWDLRTRQCLNVFESHVSVVRGLDVTQDGKLLVSGGRDRVINVWDLERGVLRKTMPVFETLESIGLVDVPVAEGKGKAKEGLTRRAVFTGGDKGVVRLWDLATGQEIPCPDAVVAGKTHEILDVIHTKATGTLTAVHVDLNIIVRSLPSLSISQQVIGFNDEVIDLAYLSQQTGEEDQNVVETHLAVATNSDLIRVYDLSRYHVDLLAGHGDVALCLARSTAGDVLVSGSKDKTARVWQSQSLSGDVGTTSSSTTQWVCSGIAEGHVESIGAVAMSKRERNFFITASQDRTAKVWDLAALLNKNKTLQERQAPESIKALTTSKIHDKDINALDISPNDKLLASGSQDRTAKLFAISYTTKSKSTPAAASLSLLGTFKGHKRGVWTVKFSPTDQCLATGSGDRSIKLWNLTDFTCIKTFEGHSNSILRIDFLTRGMQLTSCGSDGLVKVWNVKDEQCVATLDNHEDKIWALSVSKDESRIVSGAADSVITVWQDVTEEEELEKIAEREEQVLMEQDFENFVSVKDYTNAIQLALTMGQPKRLLRLLTEVRHTSTEMKDSFTGSINVDSVIKKLSTTSLRQLLLYIKDWNTVARTSEVAQGVLHAVFKFHSVEHVLEAIEPPKKDEDEQDDDQDEDQDVDMDKSNLQKRKPKRKLATDMKAGELLQALIPYTERHMTRADKLVRESFIVEHLLSQMQGFDDLDDVDNGMALDRVGR
ncbi:U3 small nucleolar RNA-associated protein 13 [Microbotryomycetes sp. JL221]|nr:U3 small nucleolar RNA-associated protein 13 [Microbotryomycetes sp. JL221]